MNYLDLAIAECAVRHLGQFRHDGVTPYALHPIRVVNLLIKAGVKDDTVLCAAALHDVVEDTDMTLENIADSYGSLLASVVGQLTRYEGMSRAAYIDSFETACLQAQLVKMADRIDNLLDSPKDPVSYAKEGMRLWGAIDRSQTAVPTEFHPAYEYLINLLYDQCEYPESREPLPNPENKIAVTEGTAPSFMTVPEIPTESV
ncbi:MAG: HD domain-containing protein [Ilumatobacteraceae bacterium]